MIILFFESLIFNHCRSQVNQGWDDYYQNYLSYIEKQHPFVCADELGCLARSWGIQLIVYWVDGSKYHTQVAPIIVELVNPTYDHFMVKRHVPTRDVKPSATQDYSRRTWPVLYDIAKKVFSERWENIKLAELRIHFRVNTYINQKNVSIKRPRAIFRKYHA